MSTSIGRGSVDEPDRTATEAVEVVRAIWAAEGRTMAEIDQDAGAKPCRNMKDVSFDGMAEPGSDLGSAWRDLLRREGKLSGTGDSIRDLVLGDRDR